MTGVTNQKIQRTISVLAVLPATVCTAAVGKTIYVDDDGQAAQSLPDVFLGGQRGNGLFDAEPDLKNLP